MKHKLLHTIPALAAAAALALMPAVASADIVVGPGGVVTLQGTEHLWVVDSQGTARMAGDPQALTRVPVNWNDREAATRGALEAAPRGAPLLTAGLVKIGEAIYLPEFTTGGGAPTLLHIQSADDLALIGVDAANYGVVVLDQATWERRYGFDTDTLAVGDFGLGAAAMPPADTEYTGGEQMPEDETIPVDQGPVVITVPEQPDYVIPTETEG